MPDREQVTIWYPGGETTQELVIIDPGIYSVIVTHVDGCTKTDSLIVIESCPETLFIPGAFTPNADGKNDTYYAQGTNVTNFKIIIFNRWGQALHTTTKLGFDGNWNGTFEGKDAPTGVYTYLIAYDAIKSAGKFTKETKAGYFALIR
jgi:gliding motility-associated-like protein